MESTNLKTRTYTAPTCNLTVTTKGATLPNLPHLQKPQTVDFTLQLDHPDRGESDRITLKGNSQQLDKLQQSVSQYVAELVAKFPLPSTAPTAEESDQDRGHSSIANRLYPAPGEQAPPSGLDNKTTPPDPEISEDIPSSPLSTKNISKLLGGWTSYTFETPQAASDRQPSAPEPTPIGDTSSQPATPYLTSGDRSLDHQLHLGSLANPNSGDILTLSAIQLFDLSTTLDEYAAAVVPPKSVPAPTVDTTADEPSAPTTTTTYAKGIGASNPDRPSVPVAAPANTPLSRLPNLPKLPVDSKQTNQVYDYIDEGSRPAFVSAIPWAAAAALAVGAPLLLFGSNSNSLKDLTSSVKLPAFKTPDLEAAKKSVISHLPKQDPESSPPETSTDSITANTPKPWEQQPVQPPQTPIDSRVAGTQMSSTPDKIGIAPLPPTIMGADGLVTPDPAPKVSVTAPAAIANRSSAINSMSGIAPNPLNSPSIPSLASKPQSQPPKVSSPVKAVPVTPAKIVSAAAKASQPNPAVSGKKVPPKGSIAKIPPTIPVGKTSIGSIRQPTPFSQAEMDVVQRINPAPRPLAIPKKAIGSKVKPTKIDTTTKFGNSTSMSQFQTPAPVYEPFTPPATSNPNIITPIPQTSIEGAEITNQPIVPEPQIQSSIGTNAGNPDPFDSPSLRETKRFLQGKWQADPAQPNPLQYVLQVSGKSGLVKTVAPQGEAATEYLKKTGLIKPGQKLVSPAAVGNSDQKIRVLLQPDGNVDAFMEP
jgi:hypothetical protein